jgi:type IV secretion system protein VirB4
MQLTRKLSEGERLLRWEKKASAHINVVGHYDDETLIDKNGCLIKLFQLNGIDAITQHQLTRDIYKNRRNSLFKTVSSQYALYACTIRQPTDAFPAGEFLQPFAKAVNDKYRMQITKTPLFKNTLYLGLMTKPPEGKINKVVSFLKGLHHKNNQAAYESYLSKCHEDLSNLAQHFVSALQDYQIKPLGCLKRVGRADISQALSLVGSLINLEKIEILKIPVDASTYLPRNRLFFNARLGTIETRAFDNTKRFAAIVALKNYTPYTFAGMLDKISTLPLEFVLTQSYRFFDSQTAKTKVKHQQQDFEHAEDESISQSEQLTETLDELASGEAGQGIHHLTLTCIADSQEKLNKQVADVIAAFSALDIVCVRETLACELGFWAQLPANFKYVVRGAPISTKNLAGFLSCHNPTLGRATGNFWGDAVTLLETQSGSPYYFNFHDKDVGNCLCFGSMGSGKTTLIGFLLIQSMKFGGKRIVFDKDRGLEICVRALGGHYEILKPGINTGFNPCQLKESPENKSFLHALFKRMLTIHEQTWDESDTEILTKAIDGLYTLPSSSRQLNHMAPFFGVKKTGSLRARLEEWYGEGNKAWLFDNEVDQLNVDADVLGFELGAILADVESKTPAMMYLMHRVTQAIEGQRGGIFMDEGWRALDDPYFKDVINDLSRTPRKKNNFLCLATQAAEDAASTAISKTLEEAAACKIFFPNPSAREETYCNHFGLTQREYELVKTLDTDSRYFLLNVGRGKESVVVRANLKGLEDEIAVISGREETVKLLDNIRERVGDDPKEWMPIFHEERKRKENKKTEKIE